MQHVLSRSLDDLAPAAELPELRQRAMQEASNAFVITDAGQPDHPIVDANPAFTALTGYPREAVLGRNCRFLQGPDTDPAAIGTLRQAIFTNCPEPVTILNYRADGTAFWNEVTVSPLRDVHAPARYFVGIQRDVSARVMASGLSTALAAEQDRQRLTTAVMQTLQHELRSPLSVICGYTELLLADRDATFTETQAADLALILQNGQHLERLLTSMLDLAQVQAGTLPFVRQDVALAPLLRRLHSETASQAAAKGLAFQVVAPSMLTPIRVDPVRLYEALAHLLDNAVRFTDQGSVTLTVSEVAAHLRIVIADSGRGMPPEILDHLFTGLRSGEQGLCREFGGLGIGGALAAGLIAALGGTTTAESTLGAGTRVTVTLPRDEASSGR